MITLENNKLLDHTGTVIDVSKFSTIEEVKGLDAALGHYFFSPSTMRFFCSRVYDDVLQIPGSGVAFITSEQFKTYYPNYSVEPRMYTVRMMTLDGKIEELSDFQEFKSLSQARRFMNKCAVK